MPVRSGRYSSPQIKTNRPWLKWLVGIALVFLFVFFLLFLNAGKFLVKQDPFTHVNWALVLDGEGRECDRSDAALSLYLENRIDSIILSGVRTYKTRYRSEFIRPSLIERGVNPSHIFEMRNDTYSTIEEAILAIQQFRHLQLDTVLIITSQFHTARSSYIYNFLAKGNPVCLVYPSEDMYFNPKAWWANRESMKTFVFESTKFFQSSLELWWNSMGKGYDLEGAPLILQPTELFFRAGVAAAPELQIEENEEETTDSLSIMEMDSLSESANNSSSEINADSSNLEGR